MGFQLTSENYYSDIANYEYMSVSQFNYSRYHQKYNIGFINSDGMEDETQFESVKTLKELSDLFRDFCKENGFKTNTVTYVEAV